MLYKFYIISKIIAFRLKIHPKQHLLSFYINKPFESALKFILWDFSKILTSLSGFFNKIYFVSSSNGTDIFILYFDDVYIYFILCYSLHERISSCDTFLSRSILQPTNIHFAFYVFDKTNGYQSFIRWSNDIGFD